MYVVKYFNVLRTRRKLRIYKRLTDRVAHGGTLVSEYLFWTFVIQDVSEPKLILHFKLIISCMVWKFELRLKGCTTNPTRMRAPGNCNYLWIDFQFEFENIVQIPKLKIEISINHKTCCNLVRSYFGNMYLSWII